MSLLTHFFIFNSEIGMLVCNFGGNSDAFPFNVSCALKSGCNDEASGESERAETVLYFHPKEASLDEQLALVETCSGLIDFMK
jgi:hypothetical protein